jgi:Trk-type K+ transport system membrane component
MVMIQQFILGGLNYPNHHPMILFLRRLKKIFRRRQPKPFTLTNIKYFWEKHETIFGSWE